MGFQEWIGRQETVDDLVTPTPIAALSATLNWPANRPAAGTVVPPLWHWLYFLPLAQQSEIGEDGHPRRGGFLPPVPLPRRMWAGSQLQFHAPLRIRGGLGRLRRRCARLRKIAIDNVMDVGQRNLRRTLSTDIMPNFYKDE